MLKINNKRNLTKEVIHSNIIIAGLMELLYRHDTITYEHSLQVAECMDKFSAFLNLHESKRVKLVIAALLHDIGKIGIDKNILQKKEPLTVEEWYDIKKHPLLSKDIIKSARELLETEDWVLRHHERYDGTGYPSGLKGKKIPLQSRILAVIDAFSVMTSRRPYHNIMDINSALAELVKNTGTQFDPQVIELFIRAFDSRECVVNVTRKTVLAECPTTANTFWTRLKGLIGKDITLETGLIIKPCKCIHTFLLRDEVDIIFVNKDGFVEKTYSFFSRGAITSYVKAACYALELPKGSVDRTNTKVGDIIALINKDYLKN